MHSLNIHCTVGIEPDCEKIDHDLHNSLMPATTLSPHISYENATKVAKNVHKKGISLRESIMELGFVSEQGFN